MNHQTAAHLFSLLAVTALFYGIANMQALTAAARHAWQAQAALLLAGIATVLALYFALA